MSPLVCNDTHVTCPSIRVVELNLIFDRGHARMRGIRTYPVPGGGMRLVAYSRTGIAVAELVIGPGAYDGWVGATMEALLDRFDPPLHVVRGNRE